MKMNVLSLRHLMEAETKDDLFTYMTPASDNGCVVVLFKRNLSHHKNNGTRAKFIPMYDDLNAYTNSADNICIKKTEPNKTNSTAETIR